MNDPEASVLLGSVYVLQMRFSEAWPILERAVKQTKKGTKLRELHQQALTNLALANLRGARPKEALKYSRRLYKKFGMTSSVTETYAHTRSVTLPYDEEAVHLVCSSTRLE